jgi:hypothetical protein
MEQRSRRRAISTPGERKDPSARGPVTVAASLVLHVVLGVALIQLTLVKSEWLTDFIQRQKPEVVERIGFLQLPRGPEPSEAARRGGDNLPISTAPPSTAAPMPVAPVDVPSTLSPIPTNPPKAAIEVGSGPLVGGGGDTRGVRPSYSSPPLWVPISPAVTAPLSATERLDSALAPTFAALADSIRREAMKRDPNDWTKTIGGQKYGIDPRFIRLGPVSIPTALLALLPMNQGANPAAIERQRRLDFMRQEILYQSARAAREEEFNLAVKALRERKAKEREEKKKADPPPAKIIP